MHEQQTVALHNIVIIAEPEVEAVSMEDRFAQLELQVMELRKQRMVFDRVEVPPMPKIPSANKTNKPVSQPQKLSTTIAKSPSPTLNHSYITARDANRLPKSLTLTLQVPNRTTNPLPDKVYHTTAPAYNLALAGEVLNRSLKAQSITLTPDKLFKSVVTNFKNEDQTITVECPNLGKVATILTYPRSDKKFRAEIIKALRKSQDTNFC